MIRGCPKRSRILALSVESFKIWAFPVGVMPVPTLVGPNLGKLSQLIIPHQFVHVSCLQLTGPISINSIGNATSKQVVIGNNLIFFILDALKWVELLI